MLKVNLKLYASGTATADNVASSIVPYTGRIVLISWALDGIATGVVGFSQMFQVSMQSTGQFATNDARNIIDECVIGGDGAITAANNNICVNKTTMVEGWSVKAGDRIYLHRLAVTVASSLRANVNLGIA